MKRIFIVPAILAALTLGGCSTSNIAAFLQNLADVEQQAVEVIARVRAGIAVANDVVDRIRAGVRVANDVIDRTINSVCIAVPQLNAAAQNVIAAVPNPGPKTVNAIRTARAGIDASSAACAAYLTAPPSASGRVTVLRNLWAAYQAAKTAIRDANAAQGA